MSYRVDKGSNMGKLVMLRHGQSEWNKKNLFSGWVDIPLSTEGIEEALQAGRLMKHLDFDVIFVSELIRSQMTACLALSVNQSGKVPRFIRTLDPHHKGWDTVYSDKAIDVCIPVYPAWELNERMYGALQGLNKAETKEEFGESQVQLWRRSYDIAPPQGESLENNAKRTIPYFEQMILPWLKKNKTVLISAHGNSLRSIVMNLDALTKEQVVQLEIPTGEPFAYSYEDGKFRRTSIYG